MVPRSIGYWTSRASSTERCVTGPLTSSCTSALTRASVRRCPGSMTRITAASGPRQKARREGVARWGSRSLRRWPRRTPGRRWCRNRRRIYRASRRHGVAQNVHVTVVLREAFGERFPFVASRAAAVDAQLAIERKVLPVALDGDDVDGLRLVRVNVDHEAEVGGQIAADFLPKVAGVVAAHDVPVLLHEEDVRARRVHGNVVNAVADLGSGVGDVLRAQSLVDGPPGLAAVVGTEGARGRDGDVDAAGVLRIENYGVEAQPTGAGLPAWPGAMAAQSGKLVPGLATVLRAEQGGVLDSGVDRIRIGRRGFEMPNSLEFPRMLGAVVPLMSGE